MAEYAQKAERAVEAVRRQAMRLFQDLYDPESGRADLDVNGRLLELEGTLAEALDSALTDVTKRVAQEVSARDRTTLVQHLKRAGLEGLSARVGETRLDVGLAARQLGALENLLAGASPSEVEKVFEAFVQNNVAKITSVSAGALDEMRELVSQGFREGVPTDKLSKRIEKRFGVAKSRAKLIARDQVGKLQGELNRARQKEVGVHEYIWRTSKDERVRDSHRLEGQRFSWNAPPPPGHPGEDYQCRCYAEPVLETAGPVVTEQEAPVPVQPAAEESVNLAESETVPPMVTERFSDVDQAEWEAMPLADREWAINKILKEQAEEQAKAAAAVVRPKRNLTGSLSPTPNDLQNVDIVGGTQVKISQGTNISSVVQLSNGEKAVFKPVSGEDAQAAQAFGLTNSMALNEVVVAELDAALPGGRVVPPTAMMRKGASQGSAQVFVEGARPLHELMEGLGVEDMADALGKNKSFARMTALDAVTGNMDRNVLNVLATGHRLEYADIVAIDNGLAFTSKSHSPALPVKSHIMAKMDYTLVSKELEQMTSMPVGQFEAFLAEKGIQGKPAALARERFLILQENPRFLQENAEYGTGPRTLLEKRAKERLEAKGLGE